MKPGIPQIIEMLKDSQLMVRRSAASAFNKLADHREQTLVCFHPSDNYLQMSSMRP
jgi:HEAT repeat protein